MEFLRGTIGDVGVKNRGVVKMLHSENFKSSSKTFEESPIEKSGMVFGGENLIAVVMVELVKEGGMKF